MRICSRTARRIDAFDRKLDASAVPLLLGAGFTETQPYIFERHSIDGCDLTYFDIEATSFLVHMSFRPIYMNEIDQLYGHLLLPHEPSIGASSYLTPTCMTHRPKKYPCKAAAARDRSLELVAVGLRSHALAWLDSLHSPEHYADAVPPASNMYVGRANEVAGRLQLARAAYEEQMSRLLACWNMVPFSKFAKFEGSREFVYLCLKLGRESDKGNRVMDATGFHPHVVPLRDDT